MNRIRNGLMSAILMLISVTVCWFASEGFLRLKHNSMTYHDIEMWRYADELKQTSNAPALDFDHERSKSALLQNTDIRLNTWGLHGPAIAAPQLSATPGDPHSNAFGYELMVRATFPIVSWKGTAITAATVRN